MTEDFPVSTTSTVITIIICVLLVAAMGYALVKGIWTASKKITVPIQIALFVMMLLCVVRLFFTKENAKKLYDGVEQTGIAKNVENTMRAALNMKSAEVSDSGVKPAQVASVPEPVATPVVAPTPSPVAELAPKAVAVPAPAVVEPAPQPASPPAAAVAAVAVSKPEPVHDYSHLDKGKKSYYFALPFNAKVTVGFKDNTYRVIAESLGKLGSSEKKEIGKLIFTALGKYIGNEVKVTDKSKISIESRYDEFGGYSRVFAIIPPNAID